MLAVLLLAPVGLLSPAQAGPAAAVGPALDARTAAVAQERGDDRGWQAGSAKKPDGTLFAPQAPGAPPPDSGAPGPRGSKTVIICGMTVYQVDIPYPPPKGIIVVQDPTRFPIGRIPPPACHPEPGK